MWQTDQPVIGYLTRRIKYYKKKRGSIKAIINDPFFIERYGGKKAVKQIVAERVSEYEARITEYETAISILKRSPKFKQKITLIKEH